MGRHTSQKQPSFPPRDYRNYREHYDADYAAEEDYANEDYADETRSRNPFSLWQWLLSLLLVFSFIATLVGLVFLWPSSEPPRVAPEFKTTSPLPQNQVDGLVIIRDSGECNSPSVGRVFETSPVTSLEQKAEECQRAIVEIQEGDNKGKRTLLMVSEKPGDPNLQEGETIRMSESTAADGSHAYTFTDFQRTIPLAFWIILTAVAIVIIGLGPGIRSLFGLLVTFAAVALFLLPALLHGGPPLLLAIVCGSAVLFPVLYIVHGISWKTSSALAGTLISLGLSAGLAHIAISGNQLRGLADEDNLLIQLYLPDVTVTGLMLCGFIIGALGVLNDVTIAQASTVNELAEIEPDASPWRLFAGAMKVGRDHIASMVYTLVLSYTGAALPLLLLLSVADRPFLQVLTSDVMATELLRSATGALALTLAVPITTLIAAFTVAED
ncbi:MAG: YibE/F family protein [Corynebacterium sp.]|nr:YibE/F family protein [Corynebacterium sp.]